MGQVRVRLIAPILGAALLALGCAGTASAAETVYLFLYAPGPMWKAGEPMARQDLKAHAAYIAQLARDGRVVAAGGYPDKGGMAIVRAEGPEAARRLLAADPAVVGGVFVAEIKEWTPRFGALPPPKP